MAAFGVGALHVLAIEHKPDNLEGDAYAVAIVSHLADPSKITSTDFQWFKVRGKHSVAKLKTAYSKMKEVHIELKHNDQAIDDATKLTEIGVDRIAVLTAHEISAPDQVSAAQMRQPLQTIDTHFQASPRTNVGPAAIKREDFTKPVFPDLPAIKDENEEAQQNSGLFLDGVQEHAPPFLKTSLAAVMPVKAEIGADSAVAEVQVQDALDPACLNTHLQKLIETATPEVLEDEISDLQNHKVDTPTIIGVVGNTGAGKSSVINAMLDEERLVPTNCMRACTAVVTEISWNHSNEEAAKYRGEIEFIKPIEWEKDLRACLEEVKDGNGNICREAANADTEAGVAFAKIKAVYPHKTKDQLAASSIDDLMSDGAVKAVLGTTKKVSNRDPKYFYRSLQHYVDSKEKSTETKKKSEKEKGEKKSMEYWPLIKVVRIYTKSSALSTGAIVVDLPGVHDSNAARAAVAAGYLKQCTGLWIVAPIGRAVDDKSAKTLMGESFKRQLKFDGIFSRVTFICSKTDDISITEAADSLGLEDEMAEDWERTDAIDKELNGLKQKKVDLKESKAVYMEVLTDADNSLEVWEKLKEDLEDGKTVYPPIQGSKKRKRTSSSKQSRKRPKNFSDDDDDFINDEDDEDEDSDASDESENSDDEDASSEKGDPLTSEAIEERIAQFKEDKKKARRERTEIDNKLKELNKESAELEKRKGEIETKMSAICIEGRNNYSRGAIQADFAAGIKELDQENAQEEDEDNFNPDEDLRDYDEVARSLKVFCVSSRAYQKLSGRLARDSNVPGFLSKEATEVPALQAHCRKLTEAGRAANCRRFLTDLNQLLNSLRLWSANDGTDAKLSSEQVAAEARFLKKGLATLDKSLEKSVQETLSEMKQTLAENIFENFETVVQQAIDEATTTAARWGDKNNGGFYWATYKALCRRNGVFTNARGQHDLNMQLTEPIIRGLASSWEKAFARRLPAVLQSFSRKSKSLLSTFHKEIETRCMQQGVGVAGLGMLAQQLRIYEQIFVMLTHEMVEVINTLQREANREFTPVIAQYLVSAYEFCTAEVGPGQYARMKLHMNTHVENNRQAMFTKSTEDVKARLIQMCRDVEERMANKTEEVWSAMNRDYTQVISGTQLPDGQQMPKWERSLRADISRIIEDKARAVATSESKLEDTAQSAVKHENAGTEERIEATASHD